MIYLKSNIKSSTSLQVFLLTGLWHTKNYKFAYQKAIFTPSQWKNNLSYWTKLETGLHVTKMYFILNMVTNAQFILCDGDQLRMSDSHLVANPLRVYLNYMYMRLVEKILIKKSLIFNIKKWHNSDLGYLLLHIHSSILLLFQI